MTAIRAERKCGELLRDMAQRGERDNGKGGDRKSQSQAATVKLAALGLDKHEASRFQQVAAVPQKQFDSALREAREAQQPRQIWYRICLCQLRPSLQSLRAKAAQRKANRPPRAQGETQYRVSRCY